MGFNGVVTNGASNGLHQGTYCPPGTITEQRASEQDEGNDHMITDDLRQGQACGTDIATQVVNGATVPASEGFWMNYW